MLASVTPMDRRRLLPAVGLGILLVVDLVLVVGALWPTSVTTAPTSTDAVASVSAPASPSTAARSTASPSSTASATPSPTASPSTSATPLPGPSPLTRLVVGLGDQAVWAADGGSCDAAGSVHVSTDGGRTWWSRKAPGSVTGLRPSTASVGFVVGGEDGCMLRLWRTANGGGRWSGAQSAASAWGRSAADASLVNRPEAAPVRPCPRQEPVVDLVALGRYTASVLCSGGALRSTSDGGRSWDTTVKRPGAVALSLSGTGQGAVAAVDPGCAGVVVQRLSGGRLGADRCVGGPTPAPGQVALSVTRGAVWLVAGDTVLRATAPDKTFERVSAWPTG